MPIRETFPSGPSGSLAITVEVETPATPGKYPVVLLVYGTEELREPFGSSIRKLAGDLASSGFVALIPHYLERTETPPGTGPVWEALRTSQDIWVETLGDAAKYADGRSDVEGGELGVVGFSLGGNLALRLAKLPTASPRVRDVVDFFAPISQAYGIGTDGNDRLPFVQIHHGTADDLVRPAESAELMRLLDDAHKTKDVDYFYFEYPSEGHGFKGPQAIGDSTKRTIAFLQRYLV